MAKLNQAQEQTMEEILASIRQMIADDEQRKAAPQAPESEPAQLERTMGNVSRLFAEPERDGVPVEEASPADNGNVVELAISQAIAEARAEVEAEGPETGAERVAPEEPPPPPPPARERLIERRYPPVTADEPAPVSPDRRVVATGADRRPILASEDRPPSPSLLSPRTDAAVTSAFDQLATNMLSGGARTIDELVEDMMRPMLRDWLDDNLPALVERLVREEIERVSRGRR